MENRACIIAVSGVKNSGKTSLIVKLIPELVRRGLRVATIKHDGHRFEADRPGTDSFRHLEAGALGAAVFDGEKFQLVRRAPVDERFLLEQFPEAELPFGGMRMIDHQLRRLRMLGIGEILLAGYAGEAKGGRCVPDLVPHRGPLSGIHACLSAAKGAACLVLSVDAPLVPLAALFALMEGYRPPITVLEHGGRWEPLIGVYDRALAPLCGELLAGERSSVMRLFDAAGCESLHWEGEELLLCNCNTPEEYQRLLARAAGAGKGREEA